MNIPTRGTFDKRGCVLKEHDMVLMPDPDPKKGDAWQHGNFIGTIVSLNPDMIIVEDADGNCWDIEPGRVELQL